MNWVKNNLITIVEIINYAYDGIEIVVNGLVRFFPSNTLVVKVHDFLALVQGPLKRLKAFLVGTVG